MQPHKFTLSIKSVTDTEITCSATNALYTLSLLYDPAQKECRFSEENALADLIHKQQFQFDKIMQSALRGKMRVGQTIRCVFIEDFPFLKEADYNNYILLDRRNNDLAISATTIELANACKIYTDGSFAAETKIAGYGGFVKKADGEKEIFSQTFPEGGASNWMELLAVADGLKRLASESIIQINTDSRFVIRGMIQWMYFWKHNDWQTAFGQDVKFKGTWKEIDRLSNEKLIQLNWIKGHSGHTAHDFCHQLARKSAKIGGNDL